MDSQSMSGMPQESSSSSVGVKMEMSSAGTSSCSPDRNESICLRIAFVLHDALIRARSDAHQHHPSTSVMQPRGAMEATTAACREWWMGAC